MHTENKGVPIQQYLKGKHASRCKARGAQGWWGGRGDCGELSSGSANGRSERESTRESERVHRGKLPRAEVVECGARRCDATRHGRDAMSADGGLPGLPQSCRLASPCGNKELLQRGPRRCTLRRAWARCGCRGRLSCRWSPEHARAARAHGSTARLPFTPGACLSQQWRPLPYAPAAPRRDAPSGQPDQARHGGVGRPGLTPVRAPSSWVCAPA